MNLMYPQFLWAFLLLIIPIVIHLFNFRRYKTLYFSSLLFIKKVEEEAKSTRNIKHLLVLFTRLFAFSFIILAFAQPYYNTHKGKSSLSYIAIYIDNSFSMSQKGSEGELLSMAREKAKEIVNKSKNNDRFIVVSNEFNGFEQHVLTKNEALERIDEIDVSPFRKNLNELLFFINDAFNKIVKNESKSFNKKIVLLSDFQKNNIIVEENIEKNNIDIYPIQFLTQDKSNLAIDSLWFEEPNFKKGINNTIYIRVRNFLNQPLKNNELHLTINNNNRDAFFDIEASGYVDIPISYQDNQTGIKNGKVSISDKQLFFDDDFYFTFSIDSECNVLIVNGEDAVKNVGIVYGLDDFYKFKEISQQQLTRNDFNGKDLIVLNGVNDFSSGFTSLLNQFSKQGGTIAVFPGKNLDINAFNVWSQEINGPRLTKPVSKVLKIKDLAYNDLFFKAMFDKKPSQINTPIVNQYYEPSTQGKGFKLINLVNGNGLLYRIEKPYQIYIYTSSLDQAFSSFTSQALFSASLLRIGELSQKKSPLYLTIGESTFMPVYNIPDGEEALKLKSKTLEFIPEIQKQDFLSLIGITNTSLTNNLIAGHYDIVKKSKIGSLSLNYSRLESDITTVELEELYDLLKSKGYNNVKTMTYSSSADSGFLAIEKTKEYWRILLLLALLCLLSEMLILKFYK